MRKALVGLILAATGLTPVAVQAQQAEPERGSRYEQVRERYDRVRERNQQRSEPRQQRQQRQERQERREVQQAPPAPAPAQAAAPVRRDRSGDRSQARQGRGDQTQQHWRGRRDRNDRPADTSGGLVGGWQGSDDPRMREHADRYNRTARENAIRHGNEAQRREAIRESRQDRNWQGRRDDRRDRWQDRDRRQNWNRQWRNDNRYDWYSYRNRYRNIYRAGRYHDPFGYGYRRFHIGIQIGAPFYHQRYWLDDPYRYRLPYAPAGYQWVRYYNDVLLVDTWDGRVVDVIYDFFW